jgi:hypothetical protein
MPAEPLPGIRFSASAARRSTISRSGATTTLTRPFMTCSAGMRGSALARVRCNAIRPPSLEPPRDRRPVVTRLHAPDRGGFLYDHENNRVRCRITLVGDTIDTVKRTAEATVLPFRRHHDGNPPPEQSETTDDLATFCVAPPEGFEPSHLAPEASALSPELWGLANAARLPVLGGGCDTRGDMPVG